MRTIRQTHARIERDTLTTPWMFMGPGPAVTFVTVGDDLTLAFHGETIPARIEAIDALLAGVLTLRRQLEREGAARFEELAEYHDAAHDADCACLVEHGRTYLVPLVGERVPEPEPEAVPDDEVDPLTAANERMAAEDSLRYGDDLVTA